MARRLVTAKDDDSPTTDQTGSEQSDASKKPFDPQTLSRQLLVAPLLKAIERDGLDKPQSIIIDVSLKHPDGKSDTKALLLKWIAAIEPDAVSRSKTKFVPRYIFATMTGANIRRLATWIEEEAHGVAAVNKTLPARVAHRIWLDDQLERFTNKSTATIKADAAQAMFREALGSEIVWAVADTGVDASHPHFAKHGNLDLPLPLRHRDFTSNASEAEDLARTAQIDEDGHGTHVAGIIAGEFAAGDANKRKYIIEARARRRDEEGEVHAEAVEGISRMAGMAPAAKIMSLKVLQGKSGVSSNLIVAIHYIQELNGHGANIVVHGLNISVGYSFEPEWFACGRSPLCMEVDRLARSGVVVVVAAGNSGYVPPILSGPGRRRGSGVDLSINDPGNAAEAITVGSTHRDSPQNYGVSYFSSKGPTGDGRLKPDLIAPGEKILSCRTTFKASGSAERADPGVQPALEPARPRSRGRAAEPVVAEYFEDSGTSMAAPHVSGVIAAFLSARREWIGKTRAVKHLFMRTAADLGRDRNFQGTGLVDLMAALQDRQPAEERLP